MFQYSNAQWMDITWHIVCLFIIQKHKSSTSCKTIVNYLQQSCTKPSKQLKRYHLARRHYYCNYCSIFESSSLTGFAYEFLQNGFIEFLESPSLCNSCHVVQRKTETEIFQLLKMLKNIVYCVVFAKNFQLLRLL